MKKLLLLVFTVFLSYSSYAQFEPCRFTVGYYMGLTDYNYTSPNAPTYSDETPYTMSGIDFTYNFGHHAFSKTSGGNFDAGLGIYQFSDDVIMGDYGLKMLLGYKYSFLVSRKKVIAGYIKGTSQMVYMENSNVQIVPRVGAGLNISGLEVGLYGEYQKASSKTYSENYGWVYGNDAYTVGVRVSFSIR